MHIELRGERMQQAATSHGGSMRNFRQTQAGLPRRGARLGGQSFQKN